MKIFQHHIRRIIWAAFFAIVFFPRILCAQWEIADEPVHNWGVTRSLAELRANGFSFVLVGTNEGIFADYLAANMRGEWTEMNSGIPQTAKEICALFVKDSLIIALSAKGGAYYAVAQERFELTPSALQWKVLGTGLSANAFYSLAIYGNTVFVGADNGVWSLTIPTLAVAGNRVYKKQPSWTKKDSSFSRETLSLRVSDNTLYAGTRGDGIFAYPLSCPRDRQCFWQPLRPSRAALAPASVLNIGTVNYAVSVFDEYAAKRVPCDGIIVSSTGKAKLLLGRNAAAENPTIEWTDISPARYSAWFGSAINSFLVGEFPGAPHSILVGTESGGVLFSDDCGATWLEFNEGARQGLTLERSNVSSLFGDGNFVLAGVSSKSGATSGARVASASARTISRGFIADASNRIVDSSARKDNRILVTADVGSERGTAQVSLLEGQYVEVTAYSLLGKKILDIYSGEARSGITNFTFDLSPLSNGLYICVVRGKNFKLAGKFLVSR